MKVSWIEKTLKQGELAPGGEVAPVVGGVRGLPRGTPIAAMAAHGFWKCICGRLEPRGGNDGDLHFCGCGRKMQLQVGLNAKPAKVQTKVGEGR